MNPVWPLLIEPQVLAARLHERNLLLIDLCRPEQYQMAHITGAVYVSPAEIIDGTPPAVGRLPSLARLTALAQRIGLTPTTQVVTYDDEGGGWAGRMIWTLEMMGHRQWTYLNGGLPAWHAAGLPTSSDIPQVAPSNIQVNVDEGARCTIEELLLTHDRDDTLVWDARSKAEYLGQRTGSARAGRVPGAVNIDWLELMDPQRAMRLRTDLAELLASRGVTPDKMIVTHCQTHHRSGLSYLVGRLLGYPHIRAYDGSWAEWGNRNDTPITTG